MEGLLIVLKIKAAKHRLSRLVQVATRVVVRLLGWRLEGCPPTESKYVAIFAPHTSNWDAFFGLCIRFGLETRPASWIVKDTFYRWPFRRMHDWLGAIPIDRKAHQNVVDQLVEIFNDRDTMVLGITPEGTRKRVPKWKTGFYYIAKKAKVPIVMCYVDFKTKTAGLGPLLYPGDDMEADFAEFEKFCATVTPRYPENFGPVVSEKKRGGQRS